MRLCYDEYPLKTLADARLAEMKEAFEDDDRFKFLTDDQRQRRKHGVWVECEDGLFDNYEELSAHIRKGVIALRKKKRAEQEAQENDKEDTTRD